LRQFDVCENPSARSREAAPFLVVLQSHLLNEMPTAIVAPLLIDDGRSAYAEASAKVTWNGSTFILSVPELVAIDARSLSRPLGNLGAYEEGIRRALERLFTGF
jgi:toxin CcdB